MGGRNIINEGSGEVRLSSIYPDSQELNSLIE